MRIKSIYLVSLIIVFLMTGCGFKVVNQSRLIDFKIENISTSGDNRIGYKLKISCFHILKLMEKN